MTNHFSVKKKIRRESIRPNTLATQLVLGNLTWAAHLPRRARSIKSYQHPFPILFHCLHRFDTIKAPNLYQEQRAALLPGEIWQPSFRHRPTAITDRRRPDQDVLASRLSGWPGEGNAQQSPATTAGELGEPGPTTEGKAAARSPERNDLLESRNGSRNVGGEVGQTRSAWHHTRWY